MPPPVENITQSPVINRRSSTSFPASDSRQRAFSITKDHMKRSHSTHATRLSVLRLALPRSSRCPVAHVERLLQADQVNYKAAETAPSTWTVPSGSYHAPTSASATPRPPKVNSRFGRRHRAPLTPRGQRRPSAADGAGPVRHARRARRRSPLARRRRPHARSAVADRCSEFWQENGFTLKTGSRRDRHHDDRLGREPREHSG